MSKRRLELLLVFFIILFISGSAFALECNDTSLIGDVDGDGAVTELDANITLEVFTGLINPPENICCMDVDNDSVVTSSDALYIASIVSGQMEQPGRCVEAVCGNGICEAGEDEDNCPDDCVTCTDSDGGQDFYTKGTVSISSGGYFTDDCAVDVLWEAWCASPNAPYYNVTKYQCPQGCRDGACVEPVCGNNIKESGERCDGTDTGEETCASLDPNFIGGTLKCNNDCSLFDTSKCTTTPTCGDGKCEYGESYDTCPEDCSCIDSDDDGSNNGLNYFEKGTVQSDNGIFEDNCQSNKRLQENFCNGNKRGFNIVTCPGNYICSDGKCILECTDECTETVCSSGQRKSLYICGNFDDDPCLERKLERCTGGTECIDKMCRPVINATINVQTIKNIYEIGERVELTDPPDEDTGYHASQIALITTGTSNATLLFVFVLILGVVTVFTLGDDEIKKKRFSRILEDLKDAKKRHLITAGLVMLLVVGAVVMMSGLYGVYVSQPQEKPMQPIQQISAPAFSQISAESLKSDFKARYGENFDIDVDEETQAVKISGGSIDTKEILQGKDITKDNIDKVAKTIIEQNKPLMKIDTKNLEVKSVKLEKPLYPEQKHGLGVITYQQEYNDIPVEGAYVTLATSDNKIVALKSTYYPDIDVSPIPSLKKNELLDIIKQNPIPSTTSVNYFISIQDEKIFPQNMAQKKKIDPLEQQSIQNIQNIENISLVIYPKSKRDYRLIYKVDLPMTYKPLHKWQFLIDAHTGEILEKRDMIISEVSGRVTGMIYPEHIKQAQIEVPFKHERIDVSIDTGSGTSSGTRIYTSETGQYSSDATGDVTIDSSFEGLWARIINAQQDVSSHTYTNTTPFIYDWNWKDYDTSYKQEESNVFYHTNVIHDYITQPHLNVTEMNFQMPATVNIPRSCNAFYTLLNPSINFFRAGSKYNINCEATSLLSDVIYHEYGHGINDVLGLPYKYGETGNMHEGIGDYWACTINNNSCMSEGFIIGRNCLRTCENTKRYPDDYAFEPHKGAEIISGALWDTRKTLGRELTDALVVRALRLRPLSFSELLENILIADDDNGNLDDGTPHIDVICNSFYTNHGIHNYNCAGRTTEPMAIITSPVNYDKIGGVVKFIGTAYPSKGAELVGYTLKIGSILINSSTTPVLNDVLGEYYTEDIRGFYTARLTVKDSAGKESVYNINLQILPYAPDVYALFDTYESRAIVNTIKYIPISISNIGIKDAENVTVALYDNDDLVTSGLLGEFMNIKSNVFYSGREANFNNYMQTKDSIDLTDTTNAFLSFSAMYHTKFYDVAKLQISTDKTNWYEITNFIGSTIGWKNYNIPISNYLGKNIYLRFIYYTENPLIMGGLYIDNITITTDKDIRFFDDAEKGMAKWDTNSFSIVNTKIASRLKPDSKKDIIIEWTPETTGIHMLKLMVNTDDDSDISNNEANTTFKVVLDEADVLLYSYIEDSYLVINKSANVKIVVKNIGIKDAENVTVALYDNDDLVTSGLLGEFMNIKSNVFYSEAGYYPIYMQTKDPVNLTNTTDAFLHFSMMYNTKSYDTAKIQVSTDNIVWVDITNFIESTDYAWINHSVNISKYTGKNIYLRFIYTTYGSPDIYFDNIVIETDKGIKFSDDAENGMDKWYSNGFYIVNSDTYNTIKPDDSRYVVIRWIPKTTGQHSLRAVADAHKDADSDNNEYTLTYNVLPDAPDTTGEIFISSIVVTNKDNKIISTIKNIGGIDAKNVNAKLYDNFELNRILLWEKNIEILKPYDFISDDIKWIPTTEGNHIIQLEITNNNDFNLTNNFINKTVVVVKQINVTFNISRIADFDTYIAYGYNDNTIYDTFIVDGNITLQLPDTETDIYVMYSNGSLIFPHTYFNVIFNNSELKPFMIYKSNVIRTKQELKRLILHTIYVSMADWEYNTSILFLLDNLESLGIADKNLSVFTCSQWDSLNKQCKIQWQRISGEYKNQSNKVIIFMGHVGKIQAFALGEEKPYFVKSMINNTGETFRGYVQLKLQKFMNGQWIDKEIVHPRRMKWIAENDVLALDKLWNKTGYVANESGRFRVYADVLDDYDGVLIQTINGPLEASYEFTVLCPTNCDCDASGNVISCSGGGSGGIYVPITGETPLYLGENLSKQGLNNLMDKNDISDFLGDKIITDADGTHTYSQYVDLSPKGATPTKYTLEYNNIPGSTGESTYLFRNFVTSPSSSDYFYKSYVTFEKPLGQFSYGEDITLFGNEYVIGEDSDFDAKKLVLYKHGENKIFNVGETAVITINGKTYEIKLVGVVSSTQAVVSVNNNQMTLTKQKFYRLSGLDIYLDDVFYLDPDNQNNNVAKLSLGAEKLTFVDSQPVKKGIDETVIQGTSADIDVIDGKLYGFTVYVGGKTTPPRTDYLRVGSEYKDPVWETFFIEFPSVSTSGQVSADLRFSVILSSTPSLGGGGPATGAVVSKPIQKIYPIQPVQRPVQKTVQPAISQQKKNIKITPIKREEGIDLNKIMSDFFEVINP